MVNADACNKKYEVWVPPAGRVENAIESLCPKARPIDPPVKPLSTNRGLTTEEVPARTM